MGTQMRSRAREDVIVEQFPKRGRAGRATSDVIATSRGQVNSRARSTTQQSAASTRDLTRTLRADNYLRKPSRTLFLPDVGRSAACPVNSFRVSAQGAESFEARHSGSERNPPVYSRTPSVFLRNREFDERHRMREKP